MAQAFARIAALQSEAPEREKGGTPTLVRANLATATVLRSVVVSPDGRLIAVSGDDGLSRIIDSKSFKIVRSFPSASDGISTRALAFSGDGSLLMSARFNANAEIWNVRTGSKVVDLKSDSSKLYSVGYYLAGLDRYAVTAGSDGVEIWNLKRRQVAGRPGLHDGPVRTIAYSTLKDGRFVSGGEDGQLVFYLPGNRQKPLQAHSKGLFSAAFSIDNKIVASGGGDGLVKIWDAESQKLLHTLSGHSRYVLSVALSKAGNLVASGGADKVVRIWNTSNGSKQAAFEGHQKDIEGVAFIDGDARVVTVSEDKTLRVWDIATRQLVLTAVFYADGDFVAYTPDGRYTGTTAAHRRLELVANGRPRSLSAADQAALHVEQGFTNGLTVSK